MPLAADYVDRVEPFRTLLAFKIDRIAFVQRPESILLNRGKMYENVFTARALNKAVALGSVKPLHHTTFGHKYSLSFVIFELAPRGEGMDGSEPFWNAEESSAVDPELRLMQDR